MFKKIIAGLLVMGFLAFILVVSHQMHERMVVNIIQKTLEREGIKKHLAYLEDGLIKLKGEVTSHVEL